MAPKLRRKKLPSKRPRGEASTSQPNPIAPNWDLTPENPYLFGSDSAFRFYCYTGEQGPIADTFYFDSEGPEGKMGALDFEWLSVYLNFWHIQGLLNCRQSFHPDLIRLFYANLEISRSNDVPSATSLVCGKTINITMDKLSTYFNLENDGKEVYIFKNWPNFYEPIEVYRGWFSCWQHCESLSAKELPAYHRFLFLIINNIVMPKQTIKTTVERAGMFFLHHLLRKNPKFHIGYIILCHMEKTFKHGDSLPYGHLIYHILLQEGLDPNLQIWGQVVSPNSLIKPANLLSRLLGAGWVKTKDGMKAPNPNERRNLYILQENARPNQ